MSYTFDEPIVRKHTNCFKWDAYTQYRISEEAIPLWVADMDFASPLCITTKIAERACHPIYGYTMVTSSYTDAISSWLSHRHLFTIDPSWLVITPNIMTAIKTALSCFCTAEDYVLIQEPVYDNFKKSIVQCGLKPMIHTLIYDNFQYTVDWASFEKQLSHPQVKLFILCNPHNPVGKVWTREELERIAQLCLKYEVLIISDEIHQDLVFSPHKHIPIASLSPKISQHVITCTSPAKIFNTPSLSFGNIIIPNANLRSQFTAVLNTHWSGHMSPFGQIIVEEGYTKGGSWVDDLTCYIKENHNYVRTFCQENLPMIHVVPADATYLIWIDMRELGLDENTLIEGLHHQAKLWVHPGSLYGVSGSGFIRMNIAIPRQTLEEVLNRLKNYCLNL